MTVTFFGAWAAASVAFVLGIMVGVVIRGALLEDEELELAADLAAARHVARRDHLRLVSGGR